MQAENLKVNIWIYMYGLSRYLYEFCVGVLFCDCNICGKVRTIKSAYKIYKILMSSIQGE